MQAKILLFYDLPHLCAVYIAKPFTLIFQLGERCAMRPSSGDLPCRASNRERRAATHLFSAISSPRRSKRLSSRRGGSPTTDGAPPPHGEAARTYSAESTDEHACWITHLYFRKPLCFLAKHADFLQLLLECSFPSRARIRAISEFAFFAFTLHPRTQNAE